MQNRHSKWDCDYCFNIADFKKEDSIIAKWNGKKERGVVLTVNKSSMKIEYKNATEHVRTVSIEDIVYLDSVKKGWLTQDEN